MSSGRRALTVLAGLAVTGLGAALVVRPFRSLGVLVVLVVVALVAMAVSELLGARRPRPWSSWLAAGAWLLGAAVILVRPGLGIKALAVVVGVTLVVEGIGRMRGEAGAPRDERVAAVCFGLAGAILGLLALAWPDVTILVVAVVFGIRVLWFGLATVWAGLRDPRAEDTAEPGHGALRRVGTVTASVLALLLALALGGVSAWLHRSSPRVDDFYTAPSVVPDLPGQLLRSQPFTREVPARARAWRILYTTTRDEGEPAVASGLVVVGRSVGDGPHPVIAWAHGTTGVARGCAPSTLPEPFTAGAMPALGQVVDSGWALVATDYVGLGTEGPHPYLIGQGSARSVLDAVRAARQLPDLELDHRTVVWGHSQGGGAALWSGMLAPAYAPEAGVVGVAALAPASDLTGLVDGLDDVPGGALFASYVLAAYSTIYPDVRFDSYVRPGAQAALRAMSRRCLSEPKTLVSIAQSLGFNGPFFRGDPLRGALGERLAQNVPLGAIEAPLFVGQGEADPLVPSAVQAQYVADRCDRAGNGALAFRTYPGRGHVDLVADDSPAVGDLLAWTRDRFAGDAAPSGCGR